MAALDKEISNQSRDHSVMNIHQLEQYSVAVCREISLRLLCFIFVIYAHPILPVTLMPLLLSDYMKNDPPLRY